jgi:cytochrome oxidase Cu insertion factor (SCO1/SenC/PrrC family)
LRRRAGRASVSAMWTPDARLSRRKALALLPALCLDGVESTAAAANLSLYEARGRWLDDRSQAFSLNKLRGQHAIVAMAYGACRRVCSTSLRVMERLQAECDSRQLGMNFVVFGLDPAEDTPLDWAGYRASRKLDRSNWQFLSADTQAVADVANRLGVRYWRYGEHVMHDFRIVLVAPDGRIARAMTHFDEDAAAFLPA